MESRSFGSLKEFNKEYKTLREDILKRHVKEGQKARLKNAIMMYQRFNCGWVKITSVKSNMIDRIKTHEGLNSEFKLVSMV